MRMSQRTDVETDNKTRGGGTGLETPEGQSGTTPKTTGVPKSFGFIWDPRDIFYCFRAFPNSAFRLPSGGIRGGPTYFLLQGEIFFTYFPASKFPAIHRLSLWCFSLAALSC